jgi:hypothetical protein
LEFTRDGRTLVTASFDGEVRLYDVDTRTLLGVPIPIALNGSGGATAPDSRAVALPTDEGVAEVSLDPAEWQRAACRAVGRNLTKAEWVLYLDGEPRATCPQYPPAR